MTYEKASGPLEKSTVVDFLYQDVRRVGSFLAQFDPDGHLQSLTRAQQVSESASSKSGLSGSAGIPAVAKFGALSEEQVLEGANDSTTRTYDPLWANALALLDYLSSRDLIQTDVTKGRIGEFVLCNGRMTILDLTMLKKLWELPAVQEKIKQGASGSTDGTRQQRRQQQRSGSNQKYSDIDLMIQMLQVLPHGIQATIRRDDDISIWCGLQESSLIGSSSDLVLKHGYEVSGGWVAVGILDAVPDEDGEEVAAFVDGVPNATAVSAGTIIGGLAAALQPITKTFLGRPHAAYGITPLLIFRHVTVD